jgi:hypothetical protein
MRIFLTLVAVLAVWAASAPAATSAEAAPDSAQVAQNAGVDDFQFNELDFDRQGQGLPALPAAPAPEGQDNLIDLFSDQPAETLHNLPGEPSPTSTPAAEGQAKIELSAGPAKPAPAPAAAPARRSRRAQPLRPEAARAGNRWYWAHEAWRNVGAPVDCQSYLPERPLYPARCLSNVAAINVPRPFVRTIRSAR